MSETLVSSLLAPAVVAALVTVILGTAFRFWADAQIARQKAEFDRDIARLTSELVAERAEREEEQRLLSDRQRTEYSWLYTERAKAMVKISAQLFEAQEAVWAVTKDELNEAKLPSPANVFPDRFRLEKINRARAAVEAFKTTFISKRILFPIKTVATLYKMYNTFTWGPFEYTFEDEDDGREREFRNLESDPYWRVMNRSGAIEEAITELENQFRELHDPSLRRD
jgi:hypothetical protein